jgi:hypothetical protein
MRITEIYNRVFNSTGTLAVAEEGALGVALTAYIQGLIENVAHTSPAVGATSGSVLDANPLREWVLIQNNSGSNVFLALGTDAAVGEGILLATGESIEFSATRHNLYLGIINAIAEGDVELLVTEAEAPTTG